MKILAGNGNRRLAEAICRYLGMPLGNVEVGRFPDGELDVKINEDVRGRDVFIIQSTCPPVNENLMELLVMVDAARRASASRITAVMPYYGYARKDRKDEGRVPITAKLVANLLTTAGVSRVLALDLHATQIQGFFDVPVDHLFAKPIFVRHFREHFGPSRLREVVFAAPDVGRAKMARAYSGQLGGGLALVDKRRISAEETDIGFVIGDVAGREVVLLDDMISTGGTVVTAANALKRAGAKCIRVAAVHALFCGQAAERLAAAPIEEILVTDSVPLNCRAQALEQQGRIRVLTVAGLLGEAMRRIHTNQSVSSLFSDNPKESPPWASLP